MHGQRHRLEKPFLAHHKGMQRIQRLIHIPFRYMSRTQWVLYISRTWEALPRPSQGYWTHPAPGTHSIEIYVTNSISPPHITNCVLHVDIANSMSHGHITISTSRLFNTNSLSLLHITNYTRYIHITNSMSHGHITISTSRLNNPNSISLLHITNSQWVLYISRTIYTSRVSHLNMSRTQWVIYTSLSQ